MSADKSKYQITGYRGSDSNYDRDFDTGFDPSLNLRHRWGISLNLRVGEPQYYNRLLLISITILDRGVEILASNHKNDVQFFVAMLLVYYTKVGKKLVYRFQRLKAINFHFLTFS